MLAAGGIYDDTVQLREEDSDIFYTTASGYIPLTSGELVYRLLGNFYFAGDKEWLAQLLKRICYSELKSRNGKNCIRNALIAKSVRFKSRETLRLSVQRQFKRIGRFSRL